MTPSHGRDFDRAREVVRRGLRERAYPAAVVEVGTRDAPIWTEAFGALTYDNDAPVTTTETIFDIASLTKVIGTASLAMRLVENRLLGLDDPIRRWLPQWRGQDREHVTVRDLLTHSSGLSAWLPFYRDCHGRDDFQHAICALPLEYRPNAQSTYSDLGFMLLGFILEDAGRAPFRDQVLSLLNALTSRLLLFNPPPARRQETAPTERDPWRGRVLVGDVHDENAWALGGAAGHAGLFGTARGVGEFARVVLTALTGKPATGPTLASQEMVRMFAMPSHVPGSSRALGWDTMRPTSSCGTKMSPSAIGHTGFTGTSLWIDPATQVYVVFFTNRVHPTRENETIQKIRPALHDAVMEALTRT